MSDLKKLLEHPEKQNIISKLVSGESTKDVAAYLKNKYQKPDENHLRLSATLLQEFLDKYADQHSYVKKIVAKECDTKLDKQIAESLLNNKAWSKRLEESAGKHVDFKEKIVNLLTILEARTEQLFDLIQSNPEGTKTDYVFTKYIELFMMLIEKADKLVNDKPDFEVKHTYTVQMVEQQSVAFQEAIRRVLERLGPDLTYVFMDMLKDELNKLNPKNIDSLPEKVTDKTLDRDIQIIDGAIEKTKEILPDDYTEDAFEEDFS